MEEANNGLREGAIPAVVEILQNGKDEARENSAAALLSSSMPEENKVLIGALNGIPGRVELLKNGTIRGKKKILQQLSSTCL